MARQHATKIVITNVTAQPNRGRTPCNTLSIMCRGSSQITLPSMCQLVATLGTKFLSNTHDLWKRPSDCRDCVIGSTPCSPSRLRWHWSQGLDASPDGHYFCQVFFSVGTGHGRIGTGFQSHVVVVVDFVVNLSCCDDAEDTALPKA